MYTIASVESLGRPPRTLVAPEKRNRVVVPRIPKAFRQRSDSHIEYRVRAAIKGLAHAYQADIVRVVQSAN